MVRGFLYGRGEVTRQGRRAQKVSGREKMWYLRQASVAAGGARGVAGGLCVRWLARP